MKRLLTALLILSAVPAWASYKPKVDVVTAFNTTNNLAGNTNFDSGILDVRDYTQVQTHVEADQDGQMTFTFYSDSGGNQVVRNLVVPYAAANGFQLFSAPAFTPYIQYQFSNTTASAQTEMFFETKFLTKGLTPQLLRADGFISPSMISTLNRSVIVGLDSAGTYRNVPIDTEGHLKVNVNDPTTSFGDLRVAELTPQVHLTFPYNINSDIVSTNVASGGTVTQVDSMARLKTSTATTGSAVMESRDVVNYRSGLGTLCRFTAAFETSAATSIQIIGIGDEEDGFFIGYDNTTFGFLVRRGGVDTWTPQTSFNIDVLDGGDGSDNPSNLLLDHSDLNVWQISYQWLGAGEIELNIEDPVTGDFVPAHRVRYSNSTNLPSIFNPSLTLRAEVTKTAGATDLQLQTASMAGFTEGRDVMTGPINTYLDTKTTVTTEEHSFHLRNNLTFSGETNKVRLVLKNLNVGNDGGKIGAVKVYLNATLAGTPTWTAVDADTSVVSIDEVQTHTADTGKLLYAAIVGPASGQSITLEDLDIIIAPGDIVTVAVQADGSATMTSALTWQEDF